MSTKSLDLWERFATETGEDTGFRRCGLFYLSNSDEELAGWARWRDFARSVGVTTHMLSGEKRPNAGAPPAPRGRRGIFADRRHCRSGTCRAGRRARDPEARRHGASVLCGPRHRNVEGGRLSGVVTEHGTIRTKIAILAGGAWASSFCRQLGIRFPQASIRSSILSVSPGASGLPDALHTSAVSVTRRSDGGYTLAISGRGRVDPTAQQLRFASQFLPMFARRWRSLAPGGLEGFRSGHESLARWRLDRPTPMERMRILDPAVNQATIALTHSRALELLPALKKTSISAAWAGYIDSTPDGVPGIGEIATLPGFILAAGFSGHGFGIGPGAGHLIADIVTGDEPIVDPRPYHPDRFGTSAWGKVADF
jgi:glycine/D-amino acid oxidase-like deaminating enzyme